jgi:alanyl-tRNA synthetase
MGLERLLMVLQDKRTVFECDVFSPWMSTIPDLWDLDEPSLRVTCDHLRSGIVIIGDGVRPSNTGRGYVLRRLIRRVLTTLWRSDSSRTVSDVPVHLLEQTLDHFKQRSDVGDVREMLLNEEDRFETLLQRGRRVVSRRRSRGPLSDEEYGYLHDTHGLPRDLVVSLLSELE